MFKISFDKIFYLFLGFSIILFIESFIHYFSILIGYVLKDNYKYLYYYGDKSGYNDTIWGESGLVENIQSIFLLISIFFIVKVIKLVNEKKLNRTILYLYLLGLAYFFFEEISWGQHIFKWESSIFFLEKNNQQETNIHNISNLFDQLPRSLLVLWIIFPILLTLFKNLKNYFDLFKINFILPSKNLYKCSIYFLIFFLPEFIFDKFDLYPNYSDYEKIIPNDTIYDISTGQIIPQTGFNFGAIQPPDIVDFLTFNFIKLSEYHELIFSFYILLHAFYLLRYFKNKQNSQI